MLKRKNHCFTLLRGRKRNKAGAVFEALGDLDELVAVFGLARIFSSREDLKDLLGKFQEELIEIGGFLSGVNRKIFLGGKTLDMEEKIRQLEDPHLKDFCRPGVNKRSAFLHWSRAVCRRLERRVIGLKKKEYRPVVAYLNRLSLLLFWLAVKEER